MDSNEISFFTQGSIYIDNHRLVSSDNLVSNGYIHVVNGILEPPYTDLGEILPNRCEAVETKTVTVRYWYAHLFYIYNT